jgi:hypothetical protein
MKKTFIIFILLIITAPVYGATRFYLPSTNTAEITTIGFDAGWGNTTAADQIRLNKPGIKINSAMTDKVGTSVNTAISVLCRQYVSDPIAAQTIIGTVKGQVRGYEGNANHDSVSAIGIRIVSNNGATVRGTLEAITYPTLLATNEYGLSIANRYTPISSTALSSVTAQSGDRIVIEIGYHRYGTTPAGSSTLNFGDNGAIDLPEDQTTTSATMEPWIEFSQDIIFPSVTVND